MNLAALELWGLRSCALAAALAGIWIHGCVHGAAGERDKQKARDAIAAVQLVTTNAKNALESKNRQNDVAMAELVAQQAKADLARYRRDHPISGGALLSGLCGDADGDSADACAGAGDKGAIAACRSARLLLQKTAADSIARQLDAFGAEVETLNDNYRTCRATRPNPTATAVQPSGF
jgi:hypothetical protein